MKNSEDTGNALGENLWRDKIQREVALKKKNSFSQKKFINHIKICKKDHDDKAVYHQQYGYKIQR